MAKQKVEAVTSADELGVDDGQSVVEIEETEQATETEAGESGQETAEASPQPPADELKVVITMKADRALLAVQAPNCDPVYTTMEGSLDMALERVPSLVAEAKQKWEASPRYPKADLPEPLPSPTPARTPTAPKPVKTTAQPSFF